MSKILKYSVFIIIFLSLFVKSISQDLSSTQYFTNRAQMNVAMLGFNTGSEMSFYYAKRLLGFASGFNSYGLSYSSYLPKINSGYGASLLHDEVSNGMLSTTNLNIQYSYSTKMSQSNALNFGVQLTGRQTSINTLSMILPDMIDPRSGQISSSSTIGNTSSIIPDFGFGSLLKLRDFYIGLSAFHLTEPKDYFDNIIKRRYSLQFFYNYKISTYFNGDYLFTPMCLYEQQGEASKLDFGLYFNYKKVISALWYKTNIDIFKNSGSFNNKTLSLLLGYKLNDFTVKYSFDYSFIYISTQMLLTHEFSVSYSFGGNVKSKHRNVKEFLKSLKCPTY